MRNTCKRVLSQANATLTGGKIDFEQTYIASFIAQWTVNDAAGTLKVQASNEQPPSGNLATSWEPSAASWIDVPSASVTIVATTVIGLINMGQVSYRWVRLVWTRTAGTGNIIVDMNSQGF